MRATLVVPDRDPAAPSGGDRYDAQLAAHWPDDLRVCRAAGAWPHPSEADRAALRALLEGMGEGPVVLDGLVGCAVPELVAASAAVRPTVVLVHATLSAGAGAVGDEAAKLDGRERRALLAADLVVTVSAWAAADLRARHGVGDVVVARPGTEAAPVAEGSSPPQLLALAALTPVKNHAVLLEALAPLRDLLPWTLVCAGAAPDAAFADGLVRAADRHGLAGRVAWPGALEGERLEEVWHATDLLVHPSRSETWGLVVTEALAHGVPAVVARGTGAEEALTFTSDHSLGTLSAGGDMVGPGAVAGVMIGPGAVAGDMIGPGAVAGDMGGSALSSTSAAVRRAPSTGGDTVGPGTAVEVEDPANLSAVLRRWLTDVETRRAWRRAALDRRAELPGWDETARTLHTSLEEVTR